MELPRLEQQSARCSHQDLQGQQASMSQKHDIMRARDLVLSNLIVTAGELK